MKNFTNTTFTIASIIISIIIINTTNVFKFLFNPRLTPFLTNSFIIIAIITYMLEKQFGVKMPLNRITKNLLRIFIAPFRLAERVEEENIEKTIDTIEKTIGGKKIMKIKTFLKELCISWKKNKKTNASFFSMLIISMYSIIDTWTNTMENKNSIENIVFNILKNNNVTEMTINILSTFIFLGVFIIVCIGIFGRGLGDWDFIFEKAQSVLNNLNTNTNKNKIKKRIAELKKLLDDKNLHLLNEKFNVENIKRERSGFPKTTLSDFFNSLESELRNLEEIENNK